MATQDATREYVSDATALPAVDQRVRILLTLDKPGELADGLPSRIEDVVLIPGKKPAVEIHVAPPRYDGDVEIPRAGHTLALIWATDRGVLELPVAFHEVVRVGELVSAWRVRVIGPAVRVQRRHFVRVAFSGSILIYPRIEETDDLGPTIPAPRMPGLPLPSPDDGSQVAQGTTVDISEGGLRCVVDSEFEAEAPVVVSFAYAGEDFRLDARVVRAWVHTEKPSYRGEPRWETAIRFSNPDLAGDGLRKGIFAEQLRQRRSSGR
jgi:hypothetical protein